jgi:membrane fusion protein (multidrug efflux system)
MSTSAPSIRPPAGPPPAGGNGSSTTETRVAPPAAELRDGEGAPPAAPAAPVTRKRPNIGILILLLVFLGLGVFGVQRYLYARNHVVTDDSQVEGHIVPVLSRVSGYVTAVHATENQPVKAGDILIEIDDRDLRAKLAQSEADLAQARAGSGSPGVAGQAEAQLAAARAAVEQARANADRAHADLDRYRTLAPRGVISGQQLDAAEAAARTGDAQLDASLKQVQAAQAAVAGASAKFAAQLAARDQAALNLSYTRVAAPVSGVVSRKNVEVGQLLQSGQPTMSVVPLDDVWMVANFKETEVRDLDPGDRAEIEVDSYPGRKFHGSVESLSPATGAKFSLLPPDNATGNFTKVVQRIPVRIRIDGPQDAGHPLRPGMSVKTTVVTH